MERSYPTQVGETRIVGTNLGLPGNYALYLVGSGLLGMLLWAMGTIVSGGGVTARLVCVLLGAFPPALTAIVIFGFLLGKPPHFASDYIHSFGIRAFGLMNRGESPGRIHNPWNLNATKGGVDQ